MDVKLTILFLIISAIVGLSDHGSNEKLRPALKRVRVGLAVRLRGKRR